MSMSTRQVLINGVWVDGERTVEQRSVFSGEVVAKVHQASAAQVQQALQVAHGARARLAKLSSGERRNVLFGIVEGLKKRADEMAFSICVEAGKPITAAQFEVARAIETFTIAAAEVTTFTQAPPVVDAFSNTAGTEALIHRVPAGVIVGIVPFNFPLNLGVHKVAPALAVGAPIIVKPPPQAPSAQLLLAEIALSAGADPAALQVLPCDTVQAEALATDARVRVMSFTGSAAVGWKLKSKVLGKAVLELGGNAAAIVCADAQLDKAVPRLVAGAFGYAGQVCIKVQRIIVLADVWSSFVSQFLEQTKKLVVGDPKDSQTVVGPVIDTKAALRIDAWVQEAESAGAKVLAGGTFKDNLWQPTVLTDVPHHAKAYAEEIFGPVVVLEKVNTFAQAIAAVNDSQYGLQAALFTDSLAQVRQAFAEIEVGGLVVNDAPSFRSDAMPYGGVKNSGLGREGVRSTMIDYTEERVLVLR